MALTIVVRSGDTSSPPQVSFDAPRIVIGRGDGCEVRLPDPSVSHRHASIRQRGTDYIVLDEGSTNGTFVGPVRLSPQAPRVLKSGDLIRVGRIWLEVRIEQAAITQNPQLATKEIALMLVAEALAAQGENVAAELCVTEGPDAGRSLKVREFEHAYVIGRGAECDLSLNDSDTSRRHVEVMRRGEQLYVRDLGSKNGSTLADASLDSKTPRVWPKSALLGLGSTRLTYQDPILDALQELEHSADERMADDESIDPPNVTAGSPEATPELRSESPSAAVSRQAPVVAAPQRERTSGRGRGVLTTDLLVAALALVVLALSALGLFWLFRSE
jgi:pSer/pThr/pTyr-binding forkhead associated (FHA) protein